MEGVIIRYKFVYINNLLSTTTITILECGMKQRVIFKQKKGRSRMSADIQY